MPRDNFMNDQQRIKDFLIGRGKCGATPHEIIRYTGITSYSQRIGDLRNAGVSIENKRVGRTKNGKTLTAYYYRGRA